MRYINLRFTYLLTLLTVYSGNWRCSACVACDFSVVRPSLYEFCSDLYIFNLLIVFSLHWMATKWSRYLVHILV